MLTRILISFIPIIIIGLFVLIIERKNIKNININNILNVILCGFLSVIIALIFGGVMKTPLTLVYLVIIKTVPNMLNEYALVRFIYEFFVAGIPEEISKRSAIKISKPRTPYRILLYSIFIALIFMIVENYGYMNRDSSVFLGIYRAFVPIHIASQLTMALLMIKAEEKKSEGKKKISVLLQILSILIPILLHAIYNTANYLDEGKLTINGVDVLPMIIILGICTYIVAFITILKVRKKYSDNESNEVKEKTKLNIKKLILVIVMSVFIAIFFSEYNKPVETNDTLIAEEENTVIIENSAEKNR